MSTSGPRGDEDLLRALLALSGLPSTLADDPELLATYRRQRVAIDTLHNVSTESLESQDLTDAGDPGHLTGG